MIVLTKEQRRALKRVYDRCPIYPLMTAQEFRDDVTAIPITYRQFRRGVQPTFGCDGCVMIQWAGMWLGIERDGYVHS
jgi:hypothetical protein